MNSTPFRQCIGPRIVAKYLLHSVDGVVRSRTLANNHFRANEVMMDLLERHDPFVRNGLPIAWTDWDEESGGRFSYDRRFVPRYDSLPSNHSADSMVEPSAFTHPECVWLDSQAISLLLIGTPT